MELIFLTTFVALILLCLFPLGVFAIVCKLFGHLDSHRTSLTISIIIVAIATVAAALLPTGDPFGFAQGFFRTQLPVPTFVGIALTALSIWIAPIRIADQSKVTIGAILVWVTGMSCILAVMVFMGELISELGNL